METLQSMNRKTQTPVSALLPHELEMVYHDFRITTRWLESSARCYWGISQIFTTWLQMSSHLLAIRRKAGLRQICSAFTFDIQKKTSVVYSRFPVCCDVKQWLAPRFSSFFSRKLCPQSQKRFAPNVMLFAIIIIPLMIKNLWWILVKWRLA